MKILTWNVNGRVGDAAKRQIRAVIRRDPDVICLQEVTGKPGGRYPGSYPIWTAALLAGAYSVVSTVDLVALPYPEPPYESPPFPRPGGKRHGRFKRRYYNLIASRHPISTLPGLTYADEREAAFGFPEKHVAARVSFNGIEIDVHNTHVPPGVSNGLLKVHHFEAVRRRLDRDRSRRRILCGDFNAPVDEDKDGPLFDVEARWSEPWSRQDKVRWRDAEWSLLENDRMPDVYRALHRPGTQLAASHVTGRGKNRRPHRYDHIFASQDLTPVNCKYLGRWLTAGWSDHAPVEAELAVN